MSKVPTFNAKQLPGEPATWPAFRKVPLTHALRIDGPFRVETSESENEPFYCEDGYLAIDSRGYPYAIAADEFEAIYAAAAPQCMACPTDVRDLYAVASNAHMAVTAALDGRASWARARRKIVDLGRVVASFKQIVDAHFADHRSDA